MNLVSASTDAMPMIAVPSLTFNTDALTWESGSCSQRLMKLRRETRVGRDSRGAVGGLGEYGCRP